VPVVALSGRQVMPGTAAIGALAGLGVVCTTLAFVLFFTLIAEVGATRSTLVAYLNPFVAVALGAVVLSEPVTTTFALGGALIVGGSAAAAARSRRSSTIEPDVDDELGCAEDRTVAQSAGAPSSG
jgi:drug/metabolite transporter (DMT)-like permease